ncbi:SDR family oxidoreductase [Dellaglioa algida]|uniref:NAD dependent epimerase dehydratase family protein n=2 Tax=Dellaglioa algida TaxID=105612 RepID=A0A0R1HGZ3_9LACO|nr:SDR family oxidoreductase [Dellaglioa algida]KRK45805.1 NAD dependent epimerase dehydratase family protein [Dellaglioa algida DSM 15638]MDK1716289.1 SDR family oxidoreductase [Dellaglioa algida]MDK1717969.1 SDR family oxidoreductase [Dellaglioa algida]MDK1719570.1 SDR family oxidoreductase [Dellaglioa algida]MDK1720928.1 SDR family oxidoreductase [Dellaglioa algida]
MAEQKRVLVIGSNGRIGQKVTNKLSEKGYQVLAGSRHTDNLDRDNITYVYVDLLDSVDKLVKNMQAVDVVLFVAGSGGKDLMKIDLDGAVKTMEAAETAHVKRFIMLSTIYSLDREKVASSSIRNYMTAKFYADNWLMKNTQLDYTILQPGALTKESSTGKVTLNDGQASDNSLGNVADVLVSIVANDNTIGKVITMHDGETDIESAVKNS